jgi:hypothetical protein
MSELVKVLKNAKSDHLNGSLKSAKPSKLVDRQANAVTPQKIRQGNQAVQQMLRSGMIQAKLRINPPDDKYEQEADRVADRIMRMPNTLSAGTAFTGYSHGISIQRACLLCDEEKLHRLPLGEEAALEEESVEEKVAMEKEPMGERILLKKKTFGETPGVTPMLAGQIKSLRGGGRPLSKSLRSFFEPRFERDFSDVRIHTDSKAAQLARSIGARAFTLGRNIIFSEGEYSPETSSGKRLLAHELTHFVQQKDDLRSGLSTSTIYRFLRRAARPYQDVVTYSDIDRRPRADGSGTIHHGIRVHIQSQIEERPIDVDTAIDCIEAALRRDVQRIRAAGLIERNANAREAIRLSLERQRDQDVVTIEVRYTRQPERGYRVSEIQIESSDPIPIPPPEPTPPVQWICGPDVGAAVRDVWELIQIDFDGWSNMVKLEACRNLVQPYVYRRGLDPSGPRSWRLNNNAFDVLGLFLNSMHYVHHRPYHPPCGFPEGRNELDEDENTCSNTVKIGDECWLSGTVNYGTYGIMTRLCYDWSRRVAAGAIIIPPPLSPLVQLMPQLFSRLATEQIVVAYKRSQGDDPEPPRRWAIATWDRGPTGIASGGNRPRCQTTCPCRVNTGFYYVWETVVPRPSIVSIVPLGSCGPPEAPTETPTETSPPGRRS